MTNMKTTNNNSDNNDACADDDLLPVPKLTLTQSSVTVLFFSLICFWNCQHADFTFDDNSAILGNKDIRTETPLWNVFENDFWGTKMKSKLSHKSYRPLTVLTYRLNYFLSGGYHPWSFHVVNLVLHSVNCLLLLRVFSIFFGGIQWDVASGRRVFTAPRRSLFAAILFAVHPIHTESVAAVVGRADLICCILFNISLLTYIKHCHKNSVRWGSSMNLIFSLICATLAMFAKEQGITVLGVCLAYDVIMVMQLNVQFIRNFLQNQPITWKADLSLFVKRFAVVFGFIICLLVIRLNIMGNGPPKFQKMDNPASFHPSFVFRVLNYNYLYSINFWLLLSPWWLCFDWAMGCVPVITSFDDPRLLSAIFLVVLVIIFVIKVLSILHTAIGRFLVMSFCLVVIPFLPAMNIFFRVGFVVAERNLYISSIGFCMMIVFGANILCTLSAGRKIVKVCLLLLVLVFTARSINRTNDWLTEENLFKTGEDVCPLNAKVHYNIGKKSQDSGDYEVAVKYYKESIRLAPAYDQPMNNLGNILKDQKKFKEAEFYLQLAVNVTPTFAAGWMNLAVVKADLKMKEEAIRCYGEAVLHRRNYPDAFYNWGNLYIEYKEFPEAIEKFNKAIELKHDHHEAWQNKINVLTQIGESKVLVKEAQIASSIFSNDDRMHYLLGNSLGRIGIYKESIKYLQRSVKLNPKNFEAYSSLGVVYHQLKEYNKAEEYYKHSLAVNPNHSSTLQNYNKLLKVMKKN